MRYFNLLFQAKSPKCNMFNFVIVFLMQYTIILVKKEKKVNKSYKCILQTLEIKCVQSSSPRI